MIFLYFTSLVLIGVVYFVSKLDKKQKNAVMGNWLSYMWWGGDPDEANPISGLTRREVNAVQKSWTPITADLFGNGAELLRRFFTAYPEGTQFFSMVKKLPEEEYKENPQFKAHVINLMTAITNAVKNLNQPEIVVAMMVKLGESHGRRKIEEKHFNELKGVIVKMFVELLNMDEETLGAWGKTLDFWYKHIFSALNQNRSR